MNGSDTLYERDSWDRTQDKIILVETCSSEPRIVAKDIFKEQIYDKLHFFVDKAHFCAIANYTFLGERAHLDDDNIRSHSSDQGYNMHISTS